MRAPLTAMPGLTSSTSAAGDSGTVPDHDRGGDGDVLDIRNFVRFSAFY